MRVGKEERLAKLRELREEPDARAAYAVTLLQHRFGQEVVRAALRVLVNRPDASAREALVRLYDHYAAQGVTRDPGTYLRSEILRALRPVCEPGDVALLERALMTYEFPAPAFQEEAALLRSGALVTLAEMDDVRARFHATRLLADPLTDPMSGEPALTAISVLAAQGELLPLYFYVMQSQTRLHSEVGGACLRALGALPEEAIVPLVTQYAECTNPVLLVGLVDLFAAHPQLEVGLETLARLLVEVDDEDVYRYMLTALLANGDPTLRQLVLMTAEGVLDAMKARIMREVLNELGEAEDVQAALKALAVRASHGR